MRGGEPAPLRHRALWAAGGAALVAALVYACLLPASNLPAVPVSDFAEHAAAYAVLMLWGAGLVARSQQLALAAALSAFGIGLEWLQGAMALGRTSDPVDVAANTLGVGIGWALARAGLAGWMRWVEARVARA